MSMSRAAMMQSEQRAMWGHAPEGGTPTFGGEERRH